MKKYDVAAYIWPAYTGDDLRTRMFWPEGMGEWETVKAAYPKFEGHLQPRKPLWGYCNEADPAVMEMQIDQATRHGVNVFIYDWYWYDRRPFLEGCLNDGFLKAANNKNMQFYIMWANHNATHLWNRHLSSSECGSTIIWEGAVNRQDFEEMAIRLVDKYFGIENYYKIDGKPVFMLYDIGVFLKGMGSVKNARAALDWMREMVKSKGFPGMHLQCVVRGKYSFNLSGVDVSSVDDYAGIVEQLGADSFTHYQFGMVTNMTGDYAEAVERVRQEWKEIEKQYKMPYIPHVSCGWDNNPRYIELRPKISTNNTPENFEKALRMAKDYIDTHELPAPLVTVNSWNEWTETSYLEPDDLYGYGYLDAVKKVFKDQK